MAYKPLDEGRSAFLVVGGQESWRSASALSRSLSNVFDELTPIKTLREEGGFHFIGIGNKDLSSLIGRVENGGPRTTTVESVLNVGKHGFLRVLTPSREWLERAPIHGLKLVRSKVHAPSWSEMDFLRRGLTETELEAAGVAFRNNYYSKPRGCTMSDLAEELGISKSAVYHRLSSFERKLVGRMIGEGFTTFSPRQPTGSDPTDEMDLESGGELLSWTSAQW